MWQCPIPQGLCLTLGHHRQSLRCLGERGTVWTWGVGGTQEHLPIGAHEFDQPVLNVGRVCDLPLTSDRPPLV